jgi:uncharacterized membrane protein YsdA (DUF1294 family)
MWRFGNYTARNVLRFAVHEKARRCASRMKRNSTPESRIVVSSLLYVSPGSVLLEFAHGIGVPLVIFGMQIDAGRLD